MVCWRKGLGFTWGTSAAQYQKRLKDHIAAKQSSELQLKEAFAPTEAQLFEPLPDRWNAQFPGYHRYAAMETPYILGHWYDPFNRNVLKADRPIFGRVLACRCFLPSRFFPLFGAIPEYLVSSMVARCKAWRIKGDIIE